MCNSPCCGPAKYLSCARIEFKSFLYLDSSPSPDICALFFLLLLQAAQTFPWGLRAWLHFFHLHAWFLCLVIIPALPAIIPIQKLHVCDILSRDRECRVHKVLPSEHNHVAASVFFRSKPGQGWVPKAEADGWASCRPPRGKEILFFIFPNIL